MRSRILVAFSAVGILVVSSGATAPAPLAPTLNNLQPPMDGGVGVHEGGLPDRGLPQPVNMPQAEVTVPGYYANFKEAIEKNEAGGESTTIVVQPGEHRWENFLEIGQNINVRGSPNAILPVCTDASILDSGWPWLCISVCPTSTNCCSARRVRSGRRRAVLA